jgi:hypothetical protein
MADDREAMESYVRDLEGVGSRPVGLIGELLAADAVANHWRWGTSELTGRDEIISKYVSPHEAALSNTHAVVHQAIYAGSVLMLRGEYHSTFTGPVTSECVGFQGLAPEKLEPHGRPMSWRFHDIFEFEDGRIKRIWWGNDTLVVARQMGALPPTWE